MTDGGVEEHSFGHEPDDLAPGHLRSFRFGTKLYEIESVMERCLLGVDEVHRNLRLAIYLETETLDVAESAGRSAHCLGDVLRNLKIRRRAEVDVVGDEERPRSDGGCAACRVDLLRPEIRFARGIPAHLLTQSLEFSATNVGEILTRRCRRRPFVEIDRNLQLATDSFAERPREGDAVLHRRALERNEWNHVGRADPGVLTRVPAEIDPLGGGLDPGEGGIDGGFDRRDESDHRSIVGRIR